MRMYPIMLRGDRQRAVVVGGGSVATRKARTLQDAGAEVTLVAKNVAEGADLAGVRVIEAAYEAEHVAGATLVYACTDDRELNVRIAADAHRVGATVNCADQPEDCDFYAPAVVTEGDVVIAISTGGAAPALAGRLKRIIAEALPDGLADYVAALAEIREELKALCDSLDERMRIMKDLSGQGGQDRFAAGAAEALRKRMRELLSESSDG